MKKCNDTLVGHFHGMRPLAFDMEATASAFLFRSAYAMPACLRSSPFRAAPVGLRHALSQAAEVSSGDGMVVAACEAQMRRLLETDASAPADAAFILHNVAGAVDHLLTAAACDALAERLAGLRALDREDPPLSEEREKLTARFGRKLYMRYDPPLPGLWKIVLKHVRTLSDGRTFLTRLVHHVPSSVNILACFRESHDPRVRAFLDEWAPVDIGYSHTTATGVRMFTIWTGVTLGREGTTAEERERTMIIATHRRTLAPHHRFYTRLVVFLSTSPNEVVSIARFRASPDARVARFLCEHPGLRLFKNHYSSSKFAYSLK